MSETGPTPNFDVEKSFQDFMARMREIDARTAAGEPIYTPEDDTAFQAYCEKLSEFTATLPSTISDEELFALLEEADLPEYPPENDDILWDFRDSN